MSSKRYTEQFKVEAVKQVVERGYPARQVAARLGVTTHSLYAWVKRYGETAQAYSAQRDQSVELKRVQAELRRVTEERDILKKAAAYFARVSG
jgi:transposase